MGLLSLVGVGSCCCKNVFMNFIEIRKLVRINPLYRQLISNRLVLKILTIGAPKSQEGNIAEYNCFVIINFVIKFSKAVFRRFSVIYLFLKISQSLKENTCAGVSFELCKIFSNIYLQNVSELLLLYIIPQIWCTK